MKGNESLARSFFYTQRSIPYYINRSRDADLVTKIALSTTSLLHRTTLDRRASSSYLKFRSSSCCSIEHERETMLAVYIDSIGSPESPCLEYRAVPVYICTATSRPTRLPPAYPHRGRSVRDVSRDENSIGSTISMRTERKIFETCVPGQFQVDPRIMGLSLRVPDTHLGVDGELRRASGERRGIHKTSAKAITSGTT